MKVREVDTRDLDEQLPYCTTFSNLPSEVLDWMGNHLGKAFIVWNERNQIYFVSQTLYDLLGFHAHELLGNPWYEYIQPIESERLIQYIADENEHGGHIELLHKNNHTVLTDMRVKNVTHSLSGELYTVVALEEITSCKKVNEVMMDAEKMSVIGKLTASIAHEIRNPLTSIKGFLQLLRAGIDHKEEYYRIMHDEIEKIEAITSELLFMSKPSDQRMDYANAGKLIRDVVVLLQSEAKLKNIQLMIEEPISSIIYCDTSQIKQVIINIVKNAIDAMEEPGNITLYTTSDDDYTIINVEDEGVGIPEDLTNQVGVPFFTTKKSGTGLGINISREILEAHGGKLTFKRNEIKGSTFQLHFPKLENGR